MSLNNRSPGGWTMAKPKDSLAKEDVGSVSFEDSFKRLSEMAEQLEAGGLSLAEATSRFEEGMKLVQFCNELLSNAEQKITELKETYRPNSASAGFDNLDEDPEEDSDE